jgi:hypothetical protein
LPLSEKVRVEIFIPDLPEPSYNSLLEQLGNELTYSFGGCTVVSAAGKYLALDDEIYSDRINLLFSDTTFQWSSARLEIELYAERIRGVVKHGLPQEESILVAVHTVYHAT